MKLIKMMARFHVPGMAKELETLWEYGAYAEAVSIITYEGTWEVKEAWYEKVFEILPKLHGEGFRDACHTISAMKEYPNVHAGRLKEALVRGDLERQDCSFPLHQGFERERRGAGLFSGVSVYGRGARHIDLCCLVHGGRGGPAASGTFCETDGQVQDP